MNLYGDLPSLKAEIQQGGWSKPKSEQLQGQPTPKTVTSFIPTKLTPHRPISTNSSIASSAVNTSSGSTEKPSLVFKPRQASHVTPKASTSTSVAKTGIASFATVTYETTTVKVGQATPTEAGTPSEDKAGTNSNNDVEVSSRQENENGWDVYQQNATFDVPDPYNPLRPNDYLAWCEERIQLKKQAKLNEQNQRRLEELDAQRKEKEKERASLVERGDLQTLHSTLSGGGRGRGGLSNLPAWMTKGAAPVPSTASKPFVSDSRADLVQYSDREYDSSNSLRYSDRSVDQDREDDPDWGSNHDGGAKNNLGNDRNRPLSDGVSDRNNNSGSVGESILARMGHREGAGLGRDGQGMLLPLVHRSLGSGRGQVIPEDRNRNRESEIGGYGDIKKGRVDVDSYTSREQSRDREEYRQRDTSVGVGMKRKTGGLISKPSCVVLLRNMDTVDEYGQVDPTLAQETQQECERYGPVNDCVVYVVSDSDSDRTCPPEEQVRIFVEFTRQDSAARALRDLNGRFFGGRQVSASFFDEGRFARRELAPNADGE